MAALLLLSSIGTGAAAVSGKPGPTSNVAAVRAATTPIDTGERAEDDQPRYTRALADAGWDYNPACGSRFDWFPVGHRCNHRDDGTDFDGGLIPRRISGPADHGEAAAELADEMAFAGRVYGQAIDSRCSSLRVYWLPRKPGMLGLATVAPMAGDPVPCEMGIMPGLSAQVTCLVVLHESGHLLGLEHTDDPDSIMYGGGLDPDRFALCSGWGRSR